MRTPSEVLAQARKRAEAHKQAAEVGFEIVRRLRDMEPGVGVFVTATPHVEGGVELHFKTCRYETPTQLLRRLEGNDDAS